MRKSELTAALAACMIAVCAFSGCGSEPAEPVNATAPVSSETSAADTTSASAQETTETTPAQTESETTVEETSAETTAAEASAADPEAVVNEILSSVEMSTMAKVEDDRIGNYLEVDMSTVESYSMYICGSGGFADEVAVFLMTGEDSAQAVVDAAKARVESRSIDFKDYNPDEYDKLQNALIKTKGRYVLFVVSGDNDTAEGIFDKAAG
ncbi:MAG: DUF4358 domain-containing protein [Oscillospiraceae bacterium]|nr:DUF4358 domain-containing protein [Oscillospiraceae bacterium]